MLVYTPEAFWHQVFFLQVEVLIAKLNPTVQSLVLISLAGKTYWHKYY